MADEFIKGFAIFSGAGMLWLILASWYRNAGFEDEQFLGPLPEDPTVWETVGIALMDGMFWFTILGTLTFWVVIPAGRELRSYVDERGE